MESQFNQVNASYKNFRVTKVLPIHEINCTLRELIHEPSGASVMHIENDDPENLFCLSFQTFPESSNGVAHVLEHTVLCGSQKYPVKDPFFAMNRRSLNTFMNALTGSDFTCYPASTQIFKDFYNLLDVYLDAVFHPRLSELSFRQEGHRLEFEEIANPNSKLLHRGVVFNEMKGNMNSLNHRLHDALYGALYPHVTYGFNSGGDPKIIPRLTYEELITFHQKFYHPSRCLFFFYGNMPLEGHLDFIEEKALKDVVKVAPLPQIPPEPRYQQPLKITSSYPLAPHEDIVDKAVVAFGWLTCHVLEQEICLALSIIEIILLDTDASPLKYALMQSGLCKQVSSYIDTEISEAPFVIYLRGCNEEHVQELEELIISTLKQIVASGISLQSVENAIHQLEFHRSEITGDHAPFGLSLFMRSALLKQHGGKPENGLMIHSLFSALREKDSSYFTNLIQHYLLDNSHFVRVTLLPDRELESRESNEEKLILEEIRMRLTDADKERLVEEAKRLQDYQKSQELEDPDLLPKVSLSDVPRSARDLKLARQDCENVEIFHHGCFTNEILYADLAFDLPNIPEEDLFFVRLLTIILPQLGSGSRNYMENLDYIQANTGGVSLYISLNLQAENHNSFYPSVHLRGKALHRKAKKLLPLLREMIENPDFSDLERIKTIIMKHYTGLESSLNSSALKYAINLSASGLSRPAKVAEDLFGLKYYWELKKYALHFEEKKEYLLNKLIEIKKIILPSSKPQLILSCDQAMYNTLQSHHFFGLEGMAFKSSEAWDCNYPVAPIKPQGRIIASPVAFTGKVFQTVSYVDNDAAALNIASILFDNLVLHKKIREQGGAYGGGAVSNVLSGNFYFYSYRDPNIASTLAAFKESVEYIAAGNFNDSDLEEAKLEMIQGLDAPISPGSRAAVAFSWLREGKTLERRQNFRDKVIELNKQDVIQAIHRHIIPNFDQGADVVFSGKEVLERENAILNAKGLKPLEILTLEALE